MPLMRLPQVSTQPVVVSQVPFLFHLFHLLLLAESFSTMSLVHCFQVPMVCSAPHRQSFPQKRLCYPGLQLYPSRTKPLRFINTIRGRKSTFTPKFHPLPTAWTKTDIALLFPMFYGLPPTPHQTLQQPMRQFGKPFLFLRLLPFLYPTPQRHSWRCMIRVLLGRIPLMALASSPLPPPLV